VLSKKNFYETSLYIIEKLENSEDIESISKWMQIVLNDIKK
jgi:hypothetical protein